MRVDVLLDVDVPMVDGLLTRADIYKPHGTGRHPVLLARTPYAKGLNALLLSQLDPFRAARRGFVVMIQDVCGTYRSEGDFIPFEREAHDGADTIRWCLEQPWCSGQVVTWGASYLSTAQLATAALSPPGLAGIVPVMTSPDIDRDWLTTSSGALRQDFVQTWKGVVARAVSWHRDDGARRVAELHRHIDDRCRAASARWAGSDSQDRPSAPGVEVPALFVAGWFDVFLRGTIGSYRAAREAAPDAVHQLIIGPWTHAEFSRRAGDVDFGPSADGAAFDLPGLTLAFASWAVGSSPSVKHPSAPAPGMAVRAFVMGADVWLDLPDWPPPWTERGLGLSGEHLLASSGASSVEELRLPSDPHDPALLPGGPLLPLGDGAAGPVDLRALLDRDGVLSFEWIDQPASILLLGNVSLTCRLRLGAEIADLSALLVVTEPDGRCWELAGGFDRLRGETGSTIDVTLPLGPTAWQSTDDHRLGLVLVASALPRADAPDTDACVHVIEGSSVLLTLPVHEDGLVTPAVQPDHDEKERLA